MDQPSNQEKGKEKLDNLLQDETTEKYTLGPDLGCNKNGHYFIYRSAKDAKCRKCPIGYFLSVGAEIKEDGHIYIDGQFVI